MAANVLNAKMIDSRLVAQKRQNVDLLAVGGDGARLADEESVHFVTVQKSLFGDSAVNESVKPIVTHFQKSIYL